MFHNTKNISQQVKLDIIRHHMPTNRSYQAHQAWTPTSHLSPPWISMKSMEELCNSKTSNNGKGGSNDEKSRHQQERRGKV